LAVAGSPGDFNSGLSTLSGGVHDVLTVNGNLSMGDAIGALRGDITELSAGSGFIPSQPYSWTIATASGGVNGNAVVGTIAGPNFSTAPGMFTLNGLGNSLFLNYTPVPEPATVLAIGAGGLALGGLIRRRFRKS